MMAIETADQAHAKLADAFWWLRGFEASTTSDHDDIARELWTGLRDVREYLNRIASGYVRRIGDEQAIVLTYAEFEAIYDFVGHLNANEEEKGRAVVACRTILDAYQQEARRARELPEIAF